jgi:HlyD family secretion protein
MKKVEHAGFGKKILVGLKKLFSRKRNVVIAVVIGVLILLCGVGPLVVRALQPKTSFQTVVVSKGDLQAIVGATGTVSASQTAVLNWQTSGRIALIHVQIGDSVNAGEILSSLAPESLSQNIILARADLVSAERNLENLLNSNLPAARAYQAFLAAQDAYNTAKNRIRSTDWVRGGSDQVDTAFANLILAQKAYDGAVSFYSMFANKSDQDENKAAALSNLSAAQKRLDTAKANYDWLTGKWDTQEVDVSAADFAVAKATLEDAQREYDRLKDGPDALDIEAAQARVDAIKATLAMASLSAPFDATVTESLSEVGDLVTPGTVSFRLDNLSHLTVDVEVTEVDINRVLVGQEASVYFDAIQNVEYHGKVIKVARVGDVAQGVVNFTVTVELTDADDLVLPGMTAAINVVVDERKNVLLVPNRAIKVQDGKTIVYVLENNQPVVVPITLGASSDMDSEILTGEIKEGDVLVLNPPINLQGSGSAGFMR